MKYTSRTPLTLIVAGAAAALALAACGATESREPGPPLPPVGTMQMELSVFTEGGSGGGKQDEPNDKSHFNNAALRVGLLNLSMVIGLTPPVAVFATALTVEPTFEGGKWIWNYQTTSGAQKYQAVLSGWFDGNLREGVWLNLEMRVTCPGCKTPVEDYVWYTGRFNTEGGDGHWQVFNPEITQADQAFVRIDYIYIDETHKTLTFTNNRADGHETAGDKVEYAVEGERVTIKVNDASESLQYTGEASSQTGAGFIQVPGYNSGDKACWGADLFNTPCS